MEKRKVRIERLAFKNFKGLDNFELKNLGGSVSVYGDNATGKTTIFDGFSWLLFGKDSLNSAIFEIKTLAPDGAVKHGLEHEVKARLNIDGERLDLKKVYAEKYTKKRGDAQATFTGHTIDHFVDGVPIKKGDFDQAVGSICNEDIFKLLTNPRHFNEILHWTDRRKMLLAVCGDIDDKTVIASNDTLSGLPDILGKRTFDNHKKVIAARQAEINRELQKIPVRIDEINASKVDVPREISVIESGITAATSDLAKLNNELVQIESGGGIAAKKKKLAEVERDIIHKINNQQTVTYNLERIRKEEVDKLGLATFKSSDVVTAAVNAQTALINEKKALQDEISQLEKAMQDLRQKWHAQDKTRFAPALSATCPTCGQDLPEDQVEAARKKAQAAFNEGQATILSAIADQGKSLLKKCDGHKARVGEIDARVKQYDNEIADLEEKHQAAVVAWDTLRLAEPAPVKPDPEHEVLLAKKDKILDEIENIQADLAGVAQEYRESINKITLDLSVLEKEKMQHEANMEVDTRIAKHKANERALAAEFEKLESELYLMETFIRAKVAMLEDRINSYFKVARFQLFTTNINGGLEECCNTTFGGVPYNSMNNSARINIGLDICNTLSDHHGISLPCFIDNAEAVVELTKTDAQQIRLVVSESDKTLRIEADASKGA
jgi:DNA repair exonuclease SbcCD ATPase subunit